MLRRRARSRSRQRRGDEGRAQAFEALGRLDDAIAAYSALVSLVADPAAVLGARATVLFEQGRIGDCLADLDRAIALTPARADLHFNRAYALEAAGRHAEGADALRRYLSEAPDVSDRTSVERKVRELEAAGA